ncbi:MAG: 2-dehydropantoate 2-reductase [Alphaproteobacteria bacterium]
MHIVIVGSGAVGTLYGGWLLAGGGNVSFVSRGKNLEALRSKGLDLRGAKGAYAGGPVSAAERISDLPPADVLLITTKLYDLEEAARAAQPALKSDGLVIGLQNGVDAAETLGQMFSPSQIMVGATYASAKLAAPGVVEFGGARNTVAFGSVSGAPHKHAEPLAEIWRKAGVDAEIVADIKTMLWTKFLAFATNASLTCLARQTVGVIYHDPDLLALARQSLAEVTAIGRAEGAKIPDNAAEDTIRFLQGFPPDMVASMRHDLDAGRRMELEGVSGAVVRYGRKHNVPTPFHEIAYACLKPYKDGAH